MKRPLRDRHAVPEGEGGKPERKPTDWEAIEREHRASQLSLREIGRQCGVTEGAIRKKAKSEGWMRPLADKVREAVRERLVRTDGTQGGTHDKQPSDARTVEFAATRVADLILEHRADIREGRDMAKALMAELREAGENIAEIEDAIEEETRGDKTTKRRAMMLRAVALPTRASVIVNLASAQKTYVALERQAYNLDASPEIAPGSLVVERIERVIVRPANPDG